MRTNVRQLSTINVYTRNYMDIGMCSDAVQTFTIRRFRASAKGSLEQFAFENSDEQKAREPVNQDERGIYDGWDI